MKAAQRKELGTGRVAFLARKDEIKERIDSGRTSMSVYREYQKQVDISYSQFARYVAKFIRSKPAEIPAKNEPKVKGKEMSTLKVFKAPMDKKDLY